MKFVLQGNTLMVRREATDPQKYYGDGESRLFYHIKQQLNADRPAFLQEPGKVTRLQ